MTTTPPAILTRALTRHYGRQTALSNVTLSVASGSVYALVGPNGAGKTTLIQLLMNLQAPSSGTAEVLGLPSRQVQGEALERIGYISELQEMPDSMTVESLLRFLRPFYPTWDNVLEQQLLEDFALPPDRELRHLSRGMRMKAAFVSTLSYRPSLLILDEPFSGLDPLVRDELIQGLLDRIGDSTIFLSSHDLTEIESFASHIGYLQHGALLFSEELTTLAGRFRRVHLRPGLTRAPSPPLPASWLEVEHSEAHLRFKDSAFSTPEDAIARIRAIFPAATDISFEPLSLRDIFLVQARTSRNSRSGLPAGEVA
jgi:ABC-2 type transport system ATP-binding protein